MGETLWPYLVVILAGFLPNEAFRVAGVLFGRRVDETSEIFVWIRIVAVALLAAVVSKILFSPPAVLAGVPLWLRLFSVGVGLGAFFAMRRSLLLGIVAGEVVLIGGAWWLA
jgi:hypothetical protein